MKKVKLKAKSKKPTKIIGQVKKLAIAAKNAAIKNAKASAKTLAGKSPFKAMASKPPKKAAVKVPATKATSKKPVKPAPAPKITAAKPAQGKKAPAAPVAPAPKNAKSSTKPIEPQKVDPKKGKGVETVAVVLETKTKKPTKAQLAAMMAERMCRENACENQATTKGYCRLDYIKNWKKIKRKEMILKEGKLNNYIEELVSKYPDKYIEVIRQDLSTEVNFTKVIHDLELDESIDDLEYDGDSIDSLIGSIRKEDEGFDDTDF